jgi:large exoprotein involved in heme utilization and adhesion
VRIDDRAGLDTSGVGGGLVRIRGGELILTGRAEVHADNTGDGDATGGVRIEAGTLSMSGISAIQADAMAGGKAGAIDIRGGRVELLERARVRARSGIDAVGSAGAITVNARDLVVGGTGRDGEFAALQSTTLAGSSGDGAEVRVVAERIVFSDSGRIAATTIAAGDAGKVDVRAGSVELLRGGRIRSDTEGSGDAGEVTLRTGQLVIDGNGSQVATLAASGSSGKAGSVRVDGTDITVRNRGRITTQSSGTGDAGQVTVTARQVEVLAAGEISSDTFGPAMAGTVAVRADTIRVRDASSRISSRAGESSSQGRNVSGQAGRVVIRADEVLEIREGGQVSSGTFGSGDAGNVSVDASRLVIAARSTSQFTGITSASEPRSSGDAGAVAVRAGTIDITSGSIVSNTQGPGDAGQVTVEADAIRLARGSGSEVEFAGISSRTTRDGTGDAGNVDVTGRVVAIDKGAEISSSSANPGDAGSVAVEADQLTIRGHILRDSEKPPRFTGIRSEATAAASGARAGSVAVRAREVRLREGGKISTSTFAGDAGEVTVEARELLELRSTAEISSSALPRAEGDAGAVTVRTDRLVLAHDAAFDEQGLPLFASIRTEAFRNTVGRSGSVDVRARDIVMRGGAISSSARGEGDAGEVRVAAERIDMRDGAEIVGDARWIGDGGRVVVEADRISLRGGSEIASNTHVRPIDPRLGTPVGSVATGDAGAVRVVARDRLVIDSDGARVDPLGDEEFTGISSETGIPSIGDEGMVTSLGDAGRITVVAGRLELRDAGQISTSTRGPGDAGRVSVTARDLDLRGEPAVFTGIRSDARLGSSGDAGSVSVVAGNLTIERFGEIGSSTDAEGAAGSVAVDVGRLRIDGRGLAGFTGIRSEAGDGSLGDAGTVDVHGRDDMVVRDGGRISSSTFGKGDAGAVTVRGVHLLIAGGATDGLTGIRSRAEAGSAGVAGRVAVSVGGLELSGGQVSSGSLAGGDAGAVKVTAERVVVGGGGQITTSTEATGQAGAVSVEVAGGPLLVTGPDSRIASEVGADAVADAGSVTVTAPRIRLDSGGEVSSRNRGRGDAGVVTIAAARELRLTGGAAVTTESTSGGGGSITANAQDMLRLEERSSITTSIVGTASETAGNISIDPRFVILRGGSSIEANAPGGIGGNITIDAGRLLREIGTAIEATGALQSGTVVTSTPEVDLTSGLVVLPTVFLGIDQLLQESCSARRDEGLSSLTRSGRGGLPPGPEQPLGAAYLLPGGALAAGAPGGCGELPAAGER